MKKYPLNEVEYYSTFREMIEALPDGREFCPGISWFTRKGEENGVTLGKLRDDVRGLAAYFVKSGLVGKHIAILGENSYEWILVYFAATYCGAVAVCVDIEQPDETILQMLDMADVSAVFCIDSICDICARFAGDKITVTPLAPAPVATLIKEGAGFSSFPEVNGDMTAAIVFTSGTMNYSKPVMLSQSAILTNACDALANVAIGERAFTSLPFYHTYGLTCSVLSMLIGKAHLYINGNLKTVMRDIYLANPHTMLTVPLMLETIYSKMWQTAEEAGKAKGLRKLLDMKNIFRQSDLKSPEKRSMLCARSVLAP